MSVLAQCGYARGAKVELGLAGGVIEGAIISPRDEAPDRLEHSLSYLRQSYDRAILLFDPHFYAATLNDPRDGHLGEYHYYARNHGLGRAQFSGTQIHHYVRECLDYQHQVLGNNLTYLVSPTVQFDGFRDSWSQTALDMAGESVQYHAALHGAPPLLTSIVVSETAFQSMDATEEYLDALTEVNATGFYLILRRNSGVINAVEASSFARFMYFCYVLAVINDYRIVVGYSDLYSPLLTAAGADHTAGGWFQNLRQFSGARFSPASGGRRPKKRYSSLPLVSCPLIVPELQGIDLVGMLPQVLSGSPQDRVLQPKPAAGEAGWTDEVSCLAHWYTLSRLSDRIVAQTSAAAKIAEAIAIVQDALLLYSILERTGVTFEPQTGPGHLREWQESLAEYRSLTGL